MNDIMAIENPRGSVEKANEIRAFVHHRGNELAAEGDLILKRVKGGANLAEVAAEAKEWSENGMEDLRKKTREFIRNILIETHAAEIVREIDDRFLTGSTKIAKDTTYFKLQTVKKQIEAAIAERKAAEEPAAPLRQVPVILFGTDEAIRKLCADIKGGKRAGITGYEFAADEATEKKIVKIIESQRTLPKEEGK